MYKYDTGRPVFGCEAIGARSKSRAPLPLVFDNYLGVLAAILVDQVDDVGTALQPRQIDL